MNKLIKMCKEVFGGIIYSVFKQSQRWDKIINSVGIILGPLFIFTLVLNFMILAISFVTWSLDFIFYIPFKSEPYFVSGNIERILILLGIILLINKKLNDR